jgi:hypothetical protein
MMASGRKVEVASTKRSNYGADKNQKSERSKTKTDKILISFFSYFFRKEFLEHRT